MRVLLALTIALLGACGSVQDDYTYRTDLEGLTITWAPGQETSESVIGPNRWNCGLRAVALLRDGYEGEWDPVAVTDRIEHNLPVRDAGADEGMSTKELQLAAGLAGLRSKLYLSTAWEDLYEAPGEGYSAIVLTRDGTYSNNGFETANFHWIAVVGSATDAQGNQYIIVVEDSKGTRVAMPKGDFRRLVWWDADGLTDAMMRGSDTRPGTSLRVWR